MTVRIITSVTKKQKQTLGKFLKQKRLSSKVHVSVLSAKIARSTSYYYNLEKGLVKLHYSEVKTLFDFFGVKYEPTIK